MGINTITGADTITIYDRTFNNFASGDNAVLTFDADLVSMKTGKNENTIYSRNESGKNGKLVMRLMRGSSDDRFLQGKLAEILADFPSVQLAQGQFIKRLGDGQGNVFSDAYTLQGGVINRNVDGKENVEGDTEQGVAVYTIMFAVVKRNIQ